jgi:hypothetical protein
MSLYAKTVTMTRLLKCDVPRRQGVVIVAGGGKCAVSLISRRFPRISEGEARD